LDAGARAVNTWGMSDASGANVRRGTVYLVGAGPGDPGLLTRRGAQVLGACDAVVYDRLVGAELLDLAPPGAERIYAGKEAARHAMTQDEINSVLVEKAGQNKSVCRLKGGDPFVFGRGGEEALFCRAHGVPFEIVPGVSSSIAAPAYAGIPVTHREVAASFAVVTGHTKDDDAPPPDLPRADTLVFLMGVRALPKITSALIARGDDPQTPVALVRWGTTPLQQVAVGTLQTIEAEVARVGLKPPALIVVGQVVNLRENLRWFDARPLWGQTVIVTRAREQASGLASGLRAHGARVVQCPTIRVENLDDYSIVDKAIRELSSFDWAVFTSSNGVEQFWQRLKFGGRDARAFGSAKVAAIGPATAAALESRGIRADFVPDSSISENVAAGLIERGASSGTVLIARAVEGREVLNETLAQAGAQVLVAPCYCTAPDHSNAEEARAAIEDGTRETVWITFTSSSTVRFFLDALGADWVQARRNRFRVACIGPITAQTAREAGLEPDAIASQAGVESLVQVLASFSASVQG
jgi:uroporphyrinogen III methyltransferase/synthase